MNRETLAEVLANLAGADPNDEQVWQEKLAEADVQLAAAERGEPGSAWWVEEDADLVTPDEHPTADGEHRKTASR